MIKEGLSTFSQSVAIIQHTGNRTKETLRRGEEEISAASGWEFQQCSHSTVIVSQKHLNIGMQRNVKKKTEHCVSWTICEACFSSSPAPSWPSFKPHISGGPNTVHEHILHQLLLIISSACSLQIIQIIIKDMYHTRANTS